MNSTKIWLLASPKVLEEGKIEDKLNKILAKYPDNQKDIKKLFNGDPSTNKKYFTWMFAKFFDASDVEKATIADEIVSVVRTYDSNIAKLPSDKRDIVGFKTLGELRGFLEEFLNVRNNKIQQKKEQNEKNMTSQIQGVKKEHILYEDEGFLIISPQNEYESCIIGQDTKWCISATESENFFHSYFSQGIVFLIIVNKNVYKNSPKNTKSKTALAIRYNGDQLQGIEIFDSADNNLGNFAIIQGDAYTARYDEQGNVVSHKIGDQMVEEVWQKLSQQTSGEVVQFIRGLDGSEVSKLNPKNQFIKDIQDRKITEIENYDFGLVKLNNFDLSSFKFSHVRFTDATLDGCNFSNTVFDNCDFSYDGYGGRRHKSLNFNNCMFINCSIILQHFKDSSFINAKFTNCNFSSNKLVNCNFSQSFFKNCDLYQAILHNCDFSNVVFDNSDLYEIRQKATDFFSVKLKNCKNVPMEIRNMVNNSALEPLKESSKNNITLKIKILNS